MRLNTIAEDAGIEAPLRAWLTPDGMLVSVVGEHFENMDKALAAAPEHRPAFDARYAEYKAKFPSFIGASEDCVWGHEIEAKWMSLMDVGFVRLAGNKHSPTLYVETSIEGHDAAVRVLRSVLKSTAAIKDVLVQITNSDRVPMRGSSRSYTTPLAQFLGTTKPRQRREADLTPVGAEKKDAIGRGPVKGLGSGNTTSSQKRFEKAGVVRPGQKWWALTSESRS